MSNTIRLSILASAALLSVALPAGVQAQQANMSFFVTSTGSGKGADLGGLAGADQRCQQLAQAAGSNGKTWHAYLSAYFGNYTGRTPSLRREHSARAGPDHVRNFG